MTQSHHLNFLSTRLLHVFLIKTHLDLRLHVYIKNAVCRSNGELVNELDASAAALGAGHAKTINLHPTPASLDGKLSQHQVLEDLLYYRYGYNLQETPYTGLPQAMQKIVVPAFHNWNTICRTVGGNSLSSGPSKGFLVGRHVQ